MGACKSYMCSSAGQLLPQFVFHHLVQTASLQEGWIMWWNLVSPQAALAVTHPTLSSTYDNLHQLAVAHAYVSSITCMTHGSPVTDRRAVLATQMFFCLRWACWASQQALLFKQHVQCWTHTAVMLFFYRSSEWPRGPQVKSCLTFVCSFGQLADGPWFIF